MPNTTRSRPFRVALLFVLLAALLHFSFLGLDPLEWKLQSLELFSAELSYEVCPLFVWCGLRCFIMDIMIVLVCVSDLCWLGYKWRILLSFWVWSIIRQMILPKVVDLVGIVWTNSSYYSMRVPVVGFVSRRLLATVHAWWWFLCPFSITGDILKKWDAYREPSTWFRFSYPCVTWQKVRDIRKIWLGLDDCNASTFCMDN